MGKMALVMKWYDYTSYEMGTIAFLMKWAYDSTSYEMGTIALLMKWVR